MLLIGGSGAIGQRLKLCFNPNKYDVFAINSKQYDVTGAFPYRDMYEDVDIIVNLSGVTQNGLLSDFNRNSRNTIITNCFGAVNILSDFLPAMIKKKYGRIIMVTSVFSEINIVEQGVYSASKAFVDKLVKIAAIENAQYKITVNSIQLGYTGIGMGQPKDIDLERARNKPALKRFCSMEELYKTIDYIIETEYLTGQNIRLDGGIK